MKIAHAIASLIKDYMREYPGECRVAVPGLTNEIALAIHEALLNDKITSYLVVSENQLPNRQRKWILPNSLTSFRVGSFVAVTAPGQFSMLQEGIFGAGGVIRSFTFGEEFPFEIEDGYFSFNRILDRILRAWCPESEPDQEWLRYLIVQGLIPACRQITSDKRPQYLLDTLIDGFNPNLDSDLSDIRERFLLHCGIPGPIGGDDVSEFCDSIRRLCRGVLQEIENGARDLAKDNVDGLSLNDEEKRQLKLSIDSFLDGVGATGDTIIHAGEVLSLSGGWRNHSNRVDSCNLWKQLDRPTLGALFQVHEAKQGSDLKIEELDPGKDGIGYGMNLAIFDGAYIKVKCRYETGQTQSEFDNDRDGWKIAVKNRANELVSWECDSSGGQHIFSVDTQRITGSKSNRLPLKVQLFHGDKEERAKNFYIHICGVERPKLAVIHDSPFEVIDLIEEGNSSAIDNLNSAFHVSVMLDQATSEQPVILRDEQQLILSEQQLPTRVFRTKTPLDPSQLSAANGELVISHDGGYANISISPGDLETGEYTLEEELRVAITVGSKDKAGKLMRIFSGESKDPYPLGKLNESTRRLNSIATRMTAEDGWKPVVTNILSKELEPIEIAKPVIYLGEDTTQFNWLDKEVSRELTPLVDQYCEGRCNLISYIKAEAGENDNHPLYAYAPIYIANKQGGIEALLRDYLRAYNDILVSLRQRVERSELSRSDAFILSCLDRVVHRGTGNDGEFFLLGPWHPVVVARRYMAQRALYLAGKRYQRGNQEFKFNGLAGLLANVSGLYWGSCLKKDDLSFEEAALFGAGDPGWLAGMSKGFMNGIHLQEFLAKLRDVTSLDLSLYSQAGNNFSSNCIKRFLRAFPERRRAGFYILPGYSPQQLIDSAIETIHKNGDPAADFSLDGERMSGGIHFFLEKQPNEDARLPNTGEKVFLYHYPVEKKQECFEKHCPDIIVHPNSYSQTLESPVPLGAKSSLCRGKAKESFLIAAPSRLKGGSDKTDSLAFVSELKPEKTDPNNLGDLFHATAFNLGNLSGQEVCISKDNALLLDELSAPWLYLPSAVSDPAALVSFVKRPGGSGDSHTLWDYKHDITRRSHESYYTLSRIPASLDSTLRECLGDEIGDPKSLIKDLGKNGIAVGGESLKTTNSAKGAVGLAAAVRLFCGWEGGPSGILTNDSNTFGFVLPVDSFESILGNKVEHDGSEQNHLSDLLAVQLQLPENNFGDLIIRAISVEAKFRTKRIESRSSDVNEWFTQANETYQRFKSLTQIAKGEDGIPERLGLLELLRFGVRLNYEDGTEWLRKEKEFLTAILEGRFRLQERAINSVVISTEKSMSGDPEERDRKGKWIRLNPGHWPGVNDTPQLIGIMEKLRGLISLNETPASVEDNDNRNIGTGYGEDQGSGQVVEQSIQVSGESEASEEQLLGQGETRLQAFIIGTTKNDNSPVYLDFDGGEERKKLDTRNLYITGSSGKGKTALLKTIISSIRDQGANVMMMDMKGKDFCGDNEFVRRGKFEVSWCRHDGLPFNPLIPSPILHPGTGNTYVDCRQHIQKVASVLANTYFTGNSVQQKNTLQQAIQRCFGEHGINPHGRDSNFSLKDVPVLSEIEVELERMNADTVLGRMRDLFTYDTFREDFRSTRFEDVIGSSWIIDLSDFNDDKIKTAISQFLLVSANGYFNTQRSTGLLRLGLVFDEAHRVNSLHELGNLARQARSYGVALVLASQYPDDLNAETRLCFSTKICHGHGDEKEGVSKISQALNYKGDSEDLARLDKFEAVVQNAHQDNRLTYTLGWPHYLVCRYIVDNGPIGVEEVCNIHGIDPQKLSITELLNHMKEMGLIEIINNQLNLMEGIKFE